MDSDVLLVLSTFPDAETARRISTVVVNEKLAACANILPAVRSIYRWEGKLEEAEETVVFFKTTQERFAAFQLKLKSEHPYDLPEVIALSLADGSPEYLRWVSGETTAP